MLAYDKALQYGSPSNHGKFPIKAARQGTNNGSVRIGIQKWLVIKKQVLYGLDTIHSGAKMTRIAGPLDIKKRSTGFVLSSWYQPSAQLLLF